MCLMTVGRHMTTRFLPCQRPNNEVVELLETVLASARKGEVRAVSVVAVNSLNQVESASAGDLSDVRQSVLMSGLITSALDLRRQ